MQEVPLEELNAPESAKIVNLFHYAKDTARIHGVPCKFVLYDVSHMPIVVRMSLINDVRMSASQIRRSGYNSG